MTDLEEKIVSGGNLEIKENSLVIRLQQIEKIEDQQKRYQDLEKEAERKKKGYLTASQKRTEIKEILNKMEQAYLDAQAGVLAADLQDGMPCPVCGSVHHPKLTQIPNEVPTEEQLKKQKKLTEAAEKAASDASVQAGEAAGLMQRCREELTEGVKGYIAQFLPEEETQEILRKELPDHELCLFVKNQESSVQTGLEEIKKQKKVHQDLLKKKEEFSTVRTTHAKKNFRNYRSVLKRGRASWKVFREQLQNQLDEPVLTWIHEEDIRQRMKTDPELSQDHSGEIVYQKEICNVSQALLQGKRAAEMAETAAKYSGTETKDLTALLEQRKLLEMQIGKTQTELTTITDQINQNQQQTQQRNPDIEQLQEAEREYGKSWVKGQRKKSVSDPA